MPQIDFVVVLMLENRSFDHLFGFFPGVNGLTGNEFNLIHPFDAESDDNPKFAVGQNASYAISVGDGTRALVEGHQYTAGGKTNGSRRQASGAAERVHREL